MIKELRMMNKNIISLTSTAVVVAALTIFPGCKFFDYFKGKAKADDISAKAQKIGTGIVLASINNQPVIREGDFKKSMAQMLQSNPYFRGASLDSLPGSIKRKFFDELLKQEIIIQNAEKSGIYSDAKFIEAYEEMTKLVKKTLAVQFFEKDLFKNIEVNDSDVKTYYNENKDRFIKVAGGVLVAGSKFKTEEMADSFLATSKKNLDDFEKLAEGNKDGKFRNFGRIDKSAKGFAAAAVPAPIRDTAFGIKNLPAVEKIKVGDSFWIAHFSDKKDSEYFEIDEIKSQISGMLKNNKFKDLLDKKIKELKASMSININEDYFKEAAPSAPMLEPENKKASAAQAA